MNGSKSAESVVLDNKSISLVYHTNPSTNTYYNKFKGFIQGKTYLKDGHINLDINIDPVSVGFNPSPACKSEVFLITVIRQGGYGENRVVSQLANKVNAKPVYPPAYDESESVQAESQR